MFLPMKSRKAIPEFVTKGVDIQVNKIVEEHPDGRKTTAYEAFVYSRNEPSLPILQLSNPDNRPWYHLWKSPNRRSYDFKTEDEVAQAISAYVNEIRYEYCFKESEKFEYGIKLHERKRTETKASITSEEAERITKSIEDLLK